MDLTTGNAESVIITKEDSDADGAGTPPFR